MKPALIMLYFAVAIPLATLIGKWIERGRR